MAEAATHTHTAEAAGGIETGNEKNNTWSRCCPVHVFNTCHSLSLLPPETLLAFLHPCFESLKALPRLFTEPGERPRMIHLGNLVKEAGQ